MPSPFRVRGTAEIQSLAAPRLGFAHDGNQVCLGHNRRQHGEPRALAVAQGSRFSWELHHCLLCDLSESSCHYLLKGE